MFTLSVMSKTTWTNLRSSLYDAYHSALFLRWQRNTWIRSISSPGLNQHQGQGSSFICTLWRLLRKTYCGHHKSYCYIPSLPLNWKGTLIGWFLVHGALTKFKYIPIVAIQPLHPLGITAKARDQIMVEAVGWSKLRQIKTLGPYKVLRWPLVIWFPDLPLLIRQSGHEKLGLVTQHKRLVLLWKRKYRYFT